MRRLGVLAFAVGLLFPGSASAGLLYIGNVDHPAAGVGSELTLLSFRADQGGTSQADIAWNGSMDVVTHSATTGVAAGGNNKTRSFGSLGITDPAQLRLTFNINETDSQLIVDSLYLRFYNPAGGLLHQASLAAVPMGLSDYKGIGKSGQVFGLDPDSITSLRAVFNENIRIGMGAGHSSTDDGYETYSLAKTTVAIPEPASALLLGLGLIVSARLARRRALTR